MLLDKYYNTWCECHVKLQRDSEDHEAALLLYYSTGDQYDALGIPLKEVTCINVTDIPSHTNAYVIHTLDRTFHREPVILAMDNEKEGNEWITSISSDFLACRLPVSRRSPEKRAVWVTSLTGDVFYCNPSPEGFSLEKMVWAQVGGHMSKVSGGVDGIVWALSYDGKAYVYTGGIGGGIFVGEEYPLDDIYPQEDTQEMYIYENHRWNPVGGFTERLVE